MDSPLLECAGDGSSFHSRAPGRGSSIPTTGHEWLTCSPAAGELSAGVACAAAGERRAARCAGEYLTGGREDPGQHAVLPSMTAPADKAATLLALHRAPEILVLANVWDVVSAQVIATTAGAKALATASHSIASTFGYEDGENIPFELHLDMVARIVRAVDCLDRPVHAARRLDRASRRSPGTSGGWRATEGHSSPQLKPPRDRNAQPVTPVRDPHAKRRGLPIKQQPPRAAPRATGHDLLQRTSASAAGRVSRALPARGMPHLTSTDSFPWPCWWG